MHNKPDEDRLLSRDDVEGQFGLSKRYLETLPLGEGPRRIRIGRLVRYRVSDIRDWISEQYEESDAKH